MSGHTPAPWAVNPAVAQVDAFDSGAPVPVCRLLWPTAARSEEETEANAHLLSAAPDMLAMLHTLRKLYGAIADDLTMSPKYPWESAPQAYKDAWRAVRDLIAKAEGR